MRLLDIAIQLIITFTYTKATDNQSQLNVLIGIDFIREAINFKGQSVYDQISSTVSGVKPFNQTIGLDNYLISNLSLSDFVYRPEDLTIIVPSKVNLISLEINRSIQLNGLVAEKKGLLKRGKPKKFLVELQVKASIDISITPDPQAILASLESLKVTHKILKVKVVGHPAIAEILRSSNLFKRLIDKIIDKAVPSKVNDALKKELDQINKNGIKINQLKSHVAKIGTNGVTYPESNKEISLKALLSFVKTPNQIELEIPTELNHEVVTESDQTPVTQGFKYLEDISENTELTTNNLSANPIFVASKHIRAELNQEVINTITKVAFDEGLINFQINNQLINKVSQGKDDLFNLNTKFFEKSLPCLADYPNQNFTISINALTAPLSNITNDGKQQLINFDLSLNIKYLLDKDPNIVLLNINANAEGGVILLPVQNPELTVFINVSSIKLSKVELLQKCGKLTGDDIANALGPPLRLIPKILNLKVLQNGLSIKPDIAKPLNLTNIESTTTNGLVNIDILANF